MKPSIVSLLSLALLLSSCSSQVQKDCRFLRTVAIGTHDKPSLDKLKALPIKSQEIDALRDARVSYGEDYALMSAELDRLKRDGGTEDEVENITQWRARNASALSQILDESRRLCGTP